MVEGLVLFNRPLSLRPEDKRPLPDSARQEDLKKTEAALELNNSPKPNLLDQLEK